jgi:hypothetical protein
MNYKSIFELAKSLNRDVKVLRASCPVLIGKVKFALDDHVVININKKEYVVFAKDITGVEILNKKVVGMKND